MGIRPQDLGNFRVKVFKQRLERGDLIDSEYNAAVEAARPETKGNDAKKIATITTSQQQNLWDAQKVDVDSFKKYGITFGVG
jgi:hypothetical protein